LYFSIIEQCKPLILDDAPFTVNSSSKLIEKYEIAVSDAIDDSQLFGDIPSQYQSAQLELKYFNFNRKKVLHQEELKFVKEITPRISNINVHQQLPTQNRTQNGDVPKSALSIPIAGYTNTDDFGIQQLDVEVIKLLEFLQVL